jgi:hypothetical protein
MTDYTALRMPAGGQHLARDRRESARRNDSVGGSCRIHFGEQLDLDLRVLRTAFLKEICVPQRLLEVRREFKKIDRCFERQSYARKVLPSRLDFGLQADSRTRGPIGRDHIEPARKKQSRPTRFDKPYQATARMKSAKSRQFIAKRTHRATSRRMPAVSTPTPAELRFRGSESAHEEFSSTPCLSRFSVARLLRTRRGVESCNWPEIAGNE